MVLYSPSAFDRSITNVFALSVAQSRPVGTRLVDRLATIVRSNAADGKYLSLGETPVMSEQKDEIEHRVFAGRTYTITNKVYSASVIIKRTDIEDDSTGAIMARIREMADVATGHPDKLLIETITGGTALTGYDSNAFFSATHPSLGTSGVQSNIVTGTGTTTAAISADIGTAITTVMGFKSENAEYVWDASLTDLYLLHPPGIAASVNTSIFGQIISNTSNVGFRGYNITPISVPRLGGTDANDWYLFAANGAFKPFIFQEREPLEFKMLEGDSDMGFIRELYIYKVRYRAGMGFGRWQAAVKVTNA